MKSPVFYENQDATEFFFGAKAAGTMVVHVNTEKLKARLQEYEDKLGDPFAAAP